MIKFTHISHISKGGKMILRYLFNPFRVGKRPNGLGLFVLDGFRVRIPNARKCGSVPKGESPENKVSSE
jgi:hypothetical protein